MFALYFFPVPEKIFKQATGQLRPLKPQSSGGSTWNSPPTTGSKFSQELPQKSTKKSDNGNDGKKTHYIISYDT